ncbi:hypothetical protein E2C01_048750 [Portunus trituberculatus]|uniref:Uncharacterized protein n=1 Tax=Portunus trituberculatus TaxID=210409 RepID=A0A5B7GBY2_PORTR|nr:hypothetical protein [Portunus trituberculatus]
MYLFYFGKCRCVRDTRQFNKSPTLPQGREIHENPTKDFCKLWDLSSLYGRSKRLRTPGLAMY